MYLLRVSKKNVGLRCLIFSWLFLAHHIINLNSNGANKNKLERSRFVYRLTSGDARSLTVFDFFFIIEMAMLLLDVRS